MKWQQHFLSHLCARRKAPCKGGSRADCFLLRLVGMGVDGVQGAKGVNEGGSSVQGHGDTEGLGNFLLSGTGFEGGVGVESDATIATRGERHGE